VVGRADLYFSHDLDTSFRLFYFDNVQPTNARRSKGRTYLEIPGGIVEELLEDIDGFVDALAGCGITVLRPTAPSKNADICTPLWEARATPPLNIRDQTVILGDTIVETAPHVRARIFENDYLKPVFYQYFSAGSNWLSMPRPALARGSLDPAYFARQDIDVSRAMEDLDAEALDGLGHELVFDGAQCIRLGRDVLVNVANSNHAMGLAWLEAAFRGRFRFHKLDAIADSHIDSIVIPLRPGLLLLRSPRYRDSLPEALRSWDVIYPPETDDSRFPDYSSFGFNLASRYIDINILSIDEETVVVNSLNPEFMRALESRGMTTIPVRHRHRRLFGGGFHCFTLDSVRAGGYEDYLS
jgi:glycine amidinotransferase